MEPMAALHDTRQLEQAALQAALPEMGQVAWGSFALVILVVAAIAGLTAGAATGLLPWWLAVTLLGYVYFVAYTPLHEAVHRNLSGGQAGWTWLDECAGLLCGTITGVSFTLHRAEHFAHHRRTNQVGEDPDMVFGHGLTSVLLGTLRIVPAQYSWYVSHAWPTQTRAQRVRVLAETAAIVLVRLVPVLMGHGVAVLVLSILPNLIGIALTAVFFAWIVHEPGDDTSRWGCTASFDVRGLLKWPVTLLWLWQNYHAIHHLFPRVPFYRYHRVFHRIDETMVRLGATIHRAGRSPAAAPATLG
jgi:beta-carotene hydroxylase